MPITINLFPVYSMTHVFIVRKLWVRDGQKRPDPNRAGGTQASGPTICLGVHLQNVEKSPELGPRDQIVVFSEGRSDNEVRFSASIHSHTTWGGDAAGGWGRTRGLGPPAGPPGTRGGPPARAARRGHVCKLYLIL